MAGKKIGVIGDGNVGSALARGLKRAGHDVRTVGNDKAKIRETKHDSDALGWAEFFQRPGIVRMLKEPR